MNEEVVDDDGDDEGSEEAVAEETERHAARSIGRAWLRGRTGHI